MTRSNKCPRCNVTMTNVIVTFDTLHARCDNCGWSGTKTRKAADDVKPNTTEKP